MKPAIDKAKQYAPIALKVSVLGITLSVILVRLRADQASLSMVISELFDKRAALMIIVFALLSLLNWLLEIRKWHLLINWIRPFGLREAVRQCLAAFSAAVITPNRFGEYAIKPFYFRRAERKKVLLLKLHANLSQLLATVLFGIPGLIYTIFRYNIPLSKQKLGIVTVFVLLSGVAVYLFSRKELLIKGFSLSRVGRFYGKLPPNLNASVIVMSLARYLLFSLLFYLLLDFYGAGLDLLTCLPLITSMYLLSSALPGFALFDFVIKGGIGMWLFSLAGVPYGLVLTTVFSMWFLNFALPALVGLIFFLRFKPVSA